MQGKSRQRDDGDGWWASTFLVADEEKQDSRWLTFQFGARQDEWQTDCMTVADIIPFARSPEI
jgi:hypothetical protein